MMAAIGLRFYSLNAWHCCIVLALHEQEVQLHCYCYCYIVVAIDIVSTIAIAIVIAFVIEIICVRCDVIFSPAFSVNMCPGFDGQHDSSLCN